jgi:hypothetical protein
MEYGNRVNNPIGPELCAYYEKTMLAQAIQKTKYDRYFTMKSLSHLTVQKRSSSRSGSMLLNYTLVQTM